MKQSVLLLLLLSNFACSDKYSKADVVAHNQTGEQCSLDKAKMTILALDEVKARAKIIDSISKGKRGISFFMPDSLDIEGKPYYELRVGYNSEIRFETYYLFYIDRNNCATIKIMDPVEGDIVPLDEWRKTNKTE